ncbi:50S ribosomal protein L4 [Candidatus Woesearchaeota archaeon]|nr:ribosomal protein L4 [uncultured archaeon]MBS3150618.1 50S ribosomal protein L4 [Candidatus Woesearchaeota archaeon]
MIVKDLQGNSIKEIKLPGQFSEHYHPDLIKRDVQTIQSSNRQQYGAKKEAGLRYSSTLSKRRHDYKGIYGRGSSRTPRKVMWRRGTQFSYEGATAPNTKGGRKAHPPKSEKIFVRKINLKERRKAVRSALAATFNLDLVKKRSHNIPKDFPFIIEDKIQDIKKTKEVMSTLRGLGFEKELERTSERKIRAGKGKARGRKYRRKIGPLIVVSKECSLLKSGVNIPGVEVVDVKDLNTEMLAPGTHAGRLTLYTESSISKMEKDKLFSK